MLQEFLKDGKEGTKSLSAVGSVSSNDDFNIFLHFVSFVSILVFISFIYFFLGRGVPYLYRAYTIISIDLDSNLESLGYSDPIPRAFTCI